MQINGFDNSLCIDFDQIKKIFILQPTEGRFLTDLFEERRKVAAYFKNRNGETVDVVNPITSIFGDSELSYLAKSLELMTKADCIVCLPNISSTKRTNLEWLIATTYALPMLSITQEELDSRSSK